MLFAASGLIGRAVAARDGRIGAVKDFLVDDERWRVRWMVVDTGHWLPGRKVLIHPSAIAPIHLPPRPALPMLSFGEQMAVAVNLTARQVEASPDAREDEPVTGQLEQRLFEHYGWDPFWAASEFGGDAAVTEPSGLPLPAEMAEGRAGEAPPGDPHLGSAAALKGFAVHGADGEVGSLDNAMLDDVRWTVRRLVVSTRRWLQGKLVQIPVHVVAEVDWRGRRIDLNVARERVNSAPAWDPLAIADEIAEERMWGPFGWPGQGT